jgi:uncharacterized protein YvpB
MKQVLAAQLAEWVANNARGYTNRIGNKIKIEGTIDAYDLLVYVQSLLADRSREQIQANNVASYTGRSIETITGYLDVNAAVEGGDFAGD